MSSAKFAAVTASLLARKGDARPSIVAPIAAPPRPTLVPRDDHPVSSQPRQPDNADKLRRIVVFITQEELERLGIAVIKTGTNRHDIVRGALNDYFRKLSAEFPKPCACMEGDPAVPTRHAEIESKASVAHPAYPMCAENLDSAIIGDEDHREQVVV